MELWILGVFISIYVLIASGALLLTSLYDSRRPLANVTGPEAVQTPRSLTETMQFARSSLGTAVSRFERAIPKSPKEVSVIRKRFIRAGYRNESAVKIFYGAKLVLMVAFVALAVVTGLARFNYFIVILLCLAAGFLGPDYWLSGMIASRQKKIRRALPDALDLLVVCVEAGLGLDQATVRTAQEMVAAHPAMSDELGVIIMEQRVGVPRSEAWRHLADRTGVDTVNMLVSILVQAEQYGTSVAKTLRIQSDVIRTKRVQQVEEKAAKTTVKLIIPLALFIFPVLFVVTLAPALIQVAETFQTQFQH